MCKDNPVGFLVSINHSITNRLSHTSLIIMMSTEKAMHIMQGPGLQCFFAVSACVAHVTRALFLQVIQFTAQQKGPPVQPQPKQPDRM